MVAAGKKAVQAGNAEAPLAWPVSDTGNPYFINPLYTSGGGYMFGQGADGSFDPSDLGVGTPGSVTAYEKIGELGEKGSGVLKRSVNTDNAIALFTDGKTPFLVEGPWQLTTLDDSDINYEVSAVPGFEGMDPASPFITVDAAYVASGGKNKTLAQEFVTNYWSRADVGASSSRRPRTCRPTPTRSPRSRATTRPSPRSARPAPRTGRSCRASREMAAVWDPLGKAEAAVIGGADPTSTIKSAAKAIEAAIEVAASGVSRGGPMARPGSRSTPDTARPSLGESRGRQHRHHPRAARLARLGPRAPTAPAAR